MKIRTRLQIGVGVLAVVVAVAGVVMSVTFRQVRKAEREHDGARSVVEGMFELNTLTYDYAMHAGERTRVQWSARHASLAELLGGLECRSRERRVVVAKMREDHEDIKKLFARLAGHRGRGMGGEERVRERLQARLATQLLMKSHEMVAAASGLAQQSQKELGSMWQRASWTMMLSMTIIAVVMVGVSSWTSRSLVKPVSQLQKGTEIIGKGNLDFRVGTDARDEIGDLSRAFDQMTDSLQRVTASRVELEHEITERKRAEEEAREMNRQLEAANKELEAFAYSVSHDLRAPLRGMDGFSQALLEDYSDKLDEQGRDYLKRVRAATQRMGTLIDDLLKLSRITRSEMQRKQVDLTALTREIAAALKEAEPARDVGISVQEGLVADGDEHLLRAALENLLGNAWKFTSRQARAVIEFGATEHEGGTAYFVKDDGAGFDMAYTNKLFGAFQRLHSGAEFAGTGIGLATVQRIVHRHGGRVWAEGEVGKGATFYFTLSA